MKPKVAFICVHNSCRSQIAEALGTIMGPLSRPLPKILRVPSDRTVLSSEAPKVELIRNLIA